METDTQKIYYALSLWANHIETGDIVLCAEDAKRQGREINALNPDQMKTVIRLRELAQMALVGRIQISSNVEGDSAP